VIERPMIMSMPATARPQQAPTIGFGIPRATARGWLDGGPTARRGRLTLNCGQETARIRHVLFRDCAAAETGRARSVV
jgi:hypothetical protein